MARHSAALWCLLATVMMLAIPALAATDAGASDEAAAAPATAGDADTGAAAGDAPQPSVDDLLRKGGAEFLQWLETNGVDISHVGLLIGRGGTIASARSDVPAGTQIGIPANLVLNQQTASAQSPQLAAAFEATAERGLTLPSDIGTAMALMYETFHNPASFWAPYTQLIPLKLTHPFFYTTEEIALATTVPAIKHRIASLRETLLSNFKIIHESMLVHHPEVFGEVSEEDTQAYEAWQSQFAWATAVVNVRSIVINDEEGNPVRSLVPLLDMMVLQDSDEPTVVSEASEQGTNVAHVVPADVKAGDALTIAPDLQMQKCNIELLLTRGALFNSTRWDCAYIWHSLPPRPVDAPQTSLEAMIWDLHHDFGLISEDVYKNEGHAAVEVLHRNGEPVDGKFVLLGRLAALSRDDIGHVDKVVDGKRISVEAEHRAISRMLSAIRRDATAIREDILKLVKSGQVDADESKWSGTQTIIGGVISGILRSMDSAAHALQAHWIQQLDIDVGAPASQEEGAAASSGSEPSAAGDASQADVGVDAPADVAQDGGLVVGPGLVVEDADAAQA